MVHKCREVGQHTLTDLPVPSEALASRTIRLVKQIVVRTIAARLIGADFRL